MSLLLNIIHPYVFKLIGDTLESGPIEEFRERDEKISRFVEYSLNRGIRVLHHRAQPEDSFKGILEKCAFECDPFFNFLFDPRVDSVVTTQYGIPIRDDKPKELTAKQWKAYREMYTSHLELKTKIGIPKTCIFIGGILENCIANAAAYFRQNLVENECKIYYVPEVCVSFDKKALLKIEEQLTGAGILPLEYNSYMDLISSE